MRKKQLQRAGSTFLFIFILPLFFPVTQVFAVRSSSTNFIIEGGQIAPIYGSGSSTGFSIETGGNPISGESSSTNFKVQQGAPLDSATPAPVSETVESGSSRGFPTPIALNIEVRPISPNIVEIVFETNTSAAKARIDYGILGSYNLQVSETEGRQYHRFLLYNLSPGTRYNYRIHLEITSNRINDMGPFFFTTLPVVLAVPNVSQFIAAPGESSISLSWQNPVFSGYQRTIVVKKIGSYPINVSSGEVVFSGTGIFYEDTDVAFDILYFYTAFVENADGRFSSGVIQSAQLGVFPIEEIPEEEITPTEPPPLPPGIVPTPETGIREVLINIFTLFRQRVLEGFYRFAGVLSNLSRESREQVNNIKQGLIDQYGRIQQGIFETLTSSEREELEEFLGEEIPEEFAKDIINTITVVNLLGDEDIDWRIFADSNIFLTVPRSIFLKDVEVITVAISTEAYLLIYNEKSDAYEALIRSPHIKGKYQAIVQIIYTDNTFEEVYRVVLVDPYGIVYHRERGPWSWSRPWQILLTDKVLVEGADVRLETISRTEEWVLWPANLYNQFNPVITGGDGEFAFVVPEGTYRLIVEAEGFRIFNGKSFEVEKQVVNIDVELKRELSAVGIIVLILVVVVLGVLGIILKNRKPHVKG